MKSIKPFRKVGNVPIFTCDDSYRDIKVDYSDGEAEDVLLDLFKNNLGEERRESLLKSSWPYYYHLSEHRGNLFKWYNFPKKANVLEIGAGCGAVTEHLIKKDINLTSLELTEKRTLVNAYRNKNAKNLKLIIGNLEDYAKISENKFDAIICVGVLEYAETYIDSDRPYTTFINHLKALLKPSGFLLVAIENRFGIKYWAGSKEDHGGNGLFDSINLYPRSSGVQTFGKNELVKLLGDCGLTSARFYYPYPDYKFPRLIYSDEFYPGNGTCNFPLSQLPSPSPDRERVELFSEALAMISIEKNDLFREFSNSFLVEASLSNKASTQSVFSVLSASRKDKYNLTTSVQMEDSVLTVKKCADNKSLQHLENIVATSKNLNTKIPGINYVLPQKIDRFEVIFPFVKGKDLERKLLESILSNDDIATRNLLDKYIDLIGSLSVYDKPTRKNEIEFNKVFGDKVKLEFFKDFLCPGNIDLNFDNIIVNHDNEFVIIDYEWVFSFPIPADLIISRSFWWFFGPRYGKTLSWHNDRINLTSLGDLLTVPSFVYKEYRKYFMNLELVISMEESLQGFVSRSELSFPVSWKKIGKTKNSETVLGYIDQQNKYIESLTQSLMSIEQKNIELVSQNVKLEAKLSEISNSRGYKTLEKMRKIKSKSRFIV